MSLGPVSAMSAQRPPLRAVPIPDVVTNKQDAVLYLRGQLRKTFYIRHNNTGESFRIHPLMVENDGTIHFSCVKIYVDDSLPRVVTLEHGHLCQMTFFDEAGNPTIAVKANLLDLAPAPTPPLNDATNTAVAAPQRAETGADPANHSYKGPAAASAPSPPLDISTTEHCTVLKCTAGSCPHLHKCDGRRKERRCKGLWLAPVAFDFKKGGEKRNRRCKECMARENEYNAIKNPINNPIYNAKTSAKKMQERIAYEKATLGDEHDLTPEGLKTHRDAAISRAEELIAGYDVTCPEGYAVIFYGASTGSEGYSVVQEGVSQFRDRGYQPSIIDASGHAPDVALTSAWGPGGVSVYDCGSSKAISRAVEKALQEHFWPICDASDGKMLRLWRRCGAGAPQGIGPYHVCIRIMPLPLPHGWRRGF